MSVFELARLQLKREGKLNSRQAMSLLFKRAGQIRKYLDNQERNIKVAKNRI